METVNSDGGRKRAMGKSGVGRKMGSEERLFGVLLYRDIEIYDWAHRSVISDGQCRKEPSEMEEGRFRTTGENGTRLVRKWASDLFGPAHLNEIKCPWLAWMLN
ncbi:hypothetical protein Adt_20092 [Abeliophyllum distichum]|uniref:Uncharacterized protein n=1 Tax=Abeliophyllum distichum TaxID=126358 RepID=A0ABD1SUS6_9LAMI